LAIEEKEERKKERKKLRRMWRRAAAAFGDRRWRRNCEECEEENAKKLR
jgi:hypothetical protein